MLLNGAMKIDQRNAGASQTFTAAAALAYSVDRWYGYCTGANVTGARIATAAALNRYRFTGLAANSGVGLAQRMEASGTMHLAGANATLQVKAASSSLTSLNWALFYANSADAFGTLASPTRTSIASGSFTINATEATYLATIAIPAAASTGLELVLSGGALLGTQTLTLGDVALEPGTFTAVPPFAIRPLPLELLMCQRYFEKSFPMAVAPAQNTGSFVDGAYAVQTVGASQSSGFGDVTFKVTKRAVPGIVFFNPSAADAQARNRSVAASTSSLAISEVGERSFSASYTSGAGTAATSANVFHWTASAEL